MRALYRKLSGHGLGCLPFFDYVDRGLHWITEELDKALYRIQRPREIETRSGHLMSINPEDMDISRRLMRDGIYEPFTTEVCRNQISCGDNVVDVGANIGYFSLLFASEVGDSGRVTAFEPEPRNFELLTENVAINQYSNVDAIQAAVGESNGELGLHIHEDNKGAHSINTSDNHTTRITVPKVSIDQELSSPVDFVKIDVEGAEPIVLDGMRKTLSQDRPKIVMEYFPELWNTSAKRNLELFQEANYDVFLIDEGARQSQQTDFKSLRKRDSGNQNLLLI